MRPSVFISDIQITYKYHSIAQTKISVAFTLSHIFKQLAKYSEFRKLRHFQKWNPGTLPVSSTHADSDGKAVVSHPVTLCWAGTRMLRRRDAAYLRGA